MEIKAEVSGERLDSYLSNVTDYSRTKISKAIKNKEILVNNQETSSSYKVKENDLISINITEEEIDIIPEEMDLDIIYEDDYLAVVNKQSGVVVHPAVGNYSHTLVNGLMYHFNNVSRKESIRPGIVHRLDKDTSGLMIVAKDDKVHDLLSEMIKNKEVERIYVALVDGIIMHDTGDIDAPIGRDPNNRQKMMVTDVNSKDAFTHFRVLKRYKNANKTLIECKLKTGRTHQIRVHMAYINHPIYNDPVYGKSKKTTDFGQFLHSKTIKFIHPITKKEIFCEAPIPKEFQDYLDILEEEI